LVVRPGIYLEALQKLKFLEAPYRSLMRRRAEGLRERALRKALYHSLDALAAKRAESQ